MTPDQVRAAAPILDQIDRINNVGTNVLAVQDAEWSVSSTAGNSTAIAIVDRETADVMLNAGLRNLWSRFRKLGGKVPGDPEVEYKTVRP